VDPRTAKLLRHGRKAAALARAWGHAEDADDASQYVIEQRLKGRKGRVSNILIDYLRETHGSTRVSRGGTGQKRETRAAFSGEGLEVADPRSVDPGARIDAQHVMPPDLSTRELIVYQMTIIQDWDGVEIANALGVSEPRVSQIMKQVKKKVMSHKLWHERFVDYKHDQRASLLSIDWIKL